MVGDGIERNPHPRLRQKRYGRQATLSLHEEGRGRRLRGVRRTSISEPRRKRMLFPQIDPSGEGSDEGLQLEKRYGRLAKTSRN